MSGSGRAPDGRSDGRREARPSYHRYRAGGQPSRGHGGDRGGGRGGSRGDSRGGGRGRGKRDATRARRLTLVAIALVATASVVGAVVSSGNGGGYQRTLATSFVSAWAHQDYAAMYDDLAPRSRGSLTPSELAAIYRETMRTATAVSMRQAGKEREAGGAIDVPVLVHTRLFGTLHSSFALRFSGSGEAAKIVFSKSLEFPGLHRGETLGRQTALPARAALLTREGTTLASGPAEAAGERYSPLGAAASAIVGTVGPVPPSRRAKLEAQGVPPNAIVGLTGLERIFDARLRGEPGGELLEGSRVVAHATARAASDLRTTISAAVQSAAATALGGQYGGVVALQPRTGQVLGVAGIGLDGLQPPGSTFKMVTVTGVLQAKVASLRTVFPYETAATLDGVELHNSEEESCGGSLALAFAVSCNSVFAPLGVKLGAQRLVSTAESYGFNHSPGIPGAAESTIPPASEIQGELALGATAIGQGEVQASALEMAVVASTIGNGGRRPPPTFSLSAKPRFTTVSPRSVARNVRLMMTDVVKEGTGTAAAIPGVTVAGKTGTAELGAPTGCNSEAESEGGAEAEAGESAEAEAGEGAEGGAEEEAESTCKENNPEDTDAWFAAFAPASAPRIAVGVLLVKDGFGGETAAPVAREVLEAGLGG